jgi:hypothetical protein
VTLKKRRTVLEECAQADKVNVGRTEGNKTLGKRVSQKNGVFWDVTPCASCKNHTA